VLFSYYFEMKPTSGGKNLYWFHNFLKNFACLEYVDHGCPTEKSSTMTIRHSQCDFHREQITSHIRKR
jgi:hypothetical protein